MGLERGFRRTVILLSVGAFLLGIAVVVWKVPARLEEERRAAALRSGQDLSRGLLRGQIAEAQLVDKDRILIGLARGEIGWDDLTDEGLNLIGLATNARWRWKLWGAGFLVGVGAALVPWLLFYVTRWIVQGFTSPS